MKHKPGKEGRYPDETGNYTFKWECARCGTLLGFPQMTAEYNNKQFPMPPLPRRATDYKFVN